MRRAIFTATIVALAACSGPGQAVAADEGGTIVIANKRGNSLSRINLATGEQTHQTASCTNPHELAVSPDKVHVALACYSGRELQIYRTADLGLVKTIDLGEGALPHGVIWHQNGMLYSTAQGRGTMAVVINPLSDNAEVVEIGDRNAGTDGPHLIAVSRDGNEAWGTIVRDGIVVRYDIPGRREVSRKKMEGRTEGIALAPDESALFVAMNDGSKSYRLDPKSLETKAEVPTGQMPMRIAAHPGGRWFVTSDMGPGQLTVIDSVGNSVARTLPVAMPDRRSGQVTLVFAPDGSRLYAAETSTNTVAEVDFETGKVLRRLTAGDGGDGLAVF